jgi:hypothetical protein
MAGHIPGATLSPWLSLVLPYWQRQKAADEAFQGMARVYAGLDLEVIVVDDGSPVPYAPPSGMPWPVRVVSLPGKTEPKNPCVPINAGVREARGDYIGISNPEMLHVSPILADMRDEIERGGEDTYVTAAAWFPDGRCWHAHSSIAGKPVLGVHMPRANWHFMTMLRRTLWDRADGFDPDYRDGAGYDDADFVKRLEMAGARFVIRDDLIVHHVRNGARATWTRAMFERNRALFLEKWS